MRRFCSGRRRRRRRRRRPHAQPPSAGRWEPDRTVETVRPRHRPGLPGRGPRGLRLSAGARSRGRGAAAGSEVTRKPPPAGPWAGPWGSRPWTGYERPPRAPMFAGADSAERRRRPLRLRAARRTFRPAACRCPGQPAACRLRPAAFAAACEPDSERPGGRKEPD